MTDKFAILGVPRRYDLSDDELESKFRERSRLVHPDRFAKAAPAERLRSLEASSALNEAYRALRSPVKRAEHLLELGGAALGEHEPVPQELLLEILELRETLAEAMAARDEARVRAMTDDMEGRRQTAMARVAELFAAGGDLEEIKRQLVSLRYFQRFLDEAAGEEAA